jgi:hypothetical protein
MASLSEQVKRWTKAWNVVTGPVPRVRVIRAPLEMAGLVAPECACGRGPVTTFHGCAACQGEAVAKFLEGFQ